MKYYLFLCVSYFSSAFALYNGAPSLPEMPEQNFWIGKDSPFSMKLTYEADFLLGRKVEATSYSDSSIHSFFQGAEISWGFVDRVELYMLLGAEKITYSGYKDDIETKIKTDPSFGGDVGVRAIIAFWGETKLGLDAKYFYAWPHVSEGDNEGNRDQQWQAGLALSQTFFWFTPYIGGKISRMTLQLEGIEIQNEHPFGVFIGLGIAGSKLMFFDFEARFLDDYGFSAVAGLRF